MFSNRSILFVLLVFSSVLSGEIIVVPDYPPYADTIFTDNKRIDYSGASFWEKIQYLLEEAKYKVSAVSENNLPDKLGKKDLMVCWSDALSLDQLKKYPSSNLVILMFQPPTVAPIIYTDDYLARFSKAITWYDEWIDGEKFFKFHYGVCYPMIPDIVPFARRKFCCAMASNKTSDYEHELYSERRRMIEYFNQYPDEFDLYGLYWEEENLDIYKGWVEDKIQTLKNYKFSICFENTKELTGYITEKIFDCFQAGVIPVYFGAPNIADEIPSNCFIDWRSFSSYEDLHIYLSTITEEEFTSYLDRIKIFLTSEQAQNYTTDNAVNEIVNVLIGSAS